MLLDPLEEQFDLPSVAIELGDGSGGQREVVGDENQKTPTLQVLELDAPELVRW